MTLWNEKKRGPFEPRNRSWTRPSGLCRVGWARRDEAQAQCLQRGRTPPTAQSGCSAPTQVVSGFELTKLNVHAAMGAVASGQLRFLG
jgi:hypothetical protein